MKVRIIISININGSSCSKNDYIVEGTDDDNRNDVTMMIANDDNDDGTDHDDDYENH